MEHQSISKTKSVNSEVTNKTSLNRQNGSFSHSVYSDSKNSENMDASNSHGLFNHDFSSVPASIQTKLKIGAVNDKYEQEADTMADRVMRMPSSGFVSTSQKSDNEIQRKCSSCENEEKIQRKPNRTHNTESNVSGSYVNRALSTGGRPLDQPTRGFFEPRFGADFSNVRIYNDSHADRASRSIGARAFTLGSSIAFGQGEYRPNSDSGKRLLAHELTHTLQQSSNVIRRVPNPAASAPPSQGPRPPNSAFNPLSSARHTERVDRGLSRDSGPVVDEIESALFPTGGSGGVACTPHPANFKHTIATSLNNELKTEIGLAPVDAPNPMPVAEKTAIVAMPIIKNYYAPHAPDVTPASFMATVTRKPTNYGDDIRNNDAWFAEFLGWYAGESNSISSLLSGKCGITKDWWETDFVPWLLVSGTSFLTGSNQMRERAALSDTWNSASTDETGDITFGRGFPISEIPTTVIHEAMHKFTHTKFSSQIKSFNAVRSISDNLTEGFTEYLTRALIDPVITALQAPAIKPLNPAEEASARASIAYQSYFDKTVELRDILYRHGQDGEEAIRRAYFLGEGWRFGLLESAAGDGSPIERERSIPASLTISFADKIGTLPASAAASLLPIINYLKTRQVSTVSINSSTEDYWTELDGTWWGTDDENVLSIRRASAIRSHLIAAGIHASRITRGTSPTTSTSTDDSVIELQDLRNLTP